MTSSRRSKAKAAKSSRSDLHRARRVLTLEAEAIKALARRLDSGFVRALDILAECRGKVVVTGMGKSGHVCRKFVATLTSTGTPAVFLHAAEAAHGDAGVFVKGDAVVALSSSGETEEILRLLLVIKRLGLRLVALTGNVRSTLARAADVVVDVGVAEEACPLGLAPTASTTAALALCDAIAVALLERKGFAANDFAVLHPAGSLGRRFLKVEDLMHQGEDIPVVTEGATFQETLLQITGKRLGVTAVVGRRGALVGVITDGDLRRALERIENVRAALARELMTRNPKTIPATALAQEAVALMEKHSITSLFVSEQRSRKPVGVIHLHDLLKAGVV